MKNEKIILFNKRTIKSERKVTESMKKSVASKKYYKCANKNGNLCGLEK